MSYRIHKCTICEEIFKWRDDSCCYGSLLDEEEGTLIKMCSSKCRDQFKSFINPKIPEHVKKAISKMKKTSKDHASLMKGLQKDTLVEMTEGDFGWAQLNGFISIRKSQEKDKQF